MSVSYKFKESFIFVLLRLIINYTMSKAVCPSLALSHPIATRRRRVSDRPVIYSIILSFSIVDVTSELLVIENENTIFWQKVRYALSSPLLHGTEIYLVLK
jgi:hypothetical protein